MPFTHQAIGSTAASISNALKSLRHDDLIFGLQLDIA